jgi:DNA-binding LacI/PurR family transcriptional regulator
MSHYLQERLLKSSCSFKFHLRDSAFAKATPHTLDHFSGLQEDVSAGACDAILSSAFFSSGTSSDCSEKGLPLCHVGGWRETPFRVDLDFADLLRKAVALLAPKSKRLAFVCHFGYENANPQFRAAAAEALAACGQPQEKAVFLISNSMLNGGAEIAARFLSLPESERPDALIVLNDVIGAGLTAALVSSGARPSLAIQTNRQVPMFFALPVLRFEFDLDLLAAKAVALVLERLFTPGLPDSVEAVKAQLAEDPALRENSSNL